MHANVKYLSCGEAEALGYFQLSDMKYDDSSVVTEGVQQQSLFSFFFLFGFTPCKAEQPLQGMEL